MCTEHMNRLPDPAQEFPYLYEGFLYAETEAQAGEMFDDECPELQPVFIEMIKPGKARILAVPYAR
jgi:hypothetical protein